MFAEGAHVEQRYLEVDVQCKFHLTAIIRGAMYLSVYTDGYTPSATASI